MKVVSVNFDEENMKKLELMTRFFSESRSGLVRNAVEDCYKQTIEEIPDFAFFVSVFNGEKE